MLLSRIPSSAPRLSTARFSSSIFPRGASIPLRSPPAIKCNGAGKWRCHGRRSFRILIAVAADDREQCNWAGRWRFDCRRAFGILIAAAADVGGDDFGVLDPSYDSSSELPDRRLQSFSSSEGEESDGDVGLNPHVDLELPGKNRRDTPQAALTMAAHRIARMSSSHRRERIQPGLWLNLALLAFLALFLLFVDWWAWRVVRLPLEPFYFTRPFSISASLAAMAGYLFPPLLRLVKMHHFLREGVGKTTMGGLFFIPVGLLVAEAATHFSSVEVFNAGAITLIFLVIGFLDDTLCLLKKWNFRLPGWIKLFLQISASTCFFFWFGSSETLSRKFLVPLPRPFGLVYLGKFYLLLTAFCFASMGNGVHFMNSFDGLAGGISALAFVGMSIAVLPINPELSIFGISMAGACFGFLIHNRKNASISMGYTGSSALGGALAAMAAFTGMFFPLLICSGTLFLEQLLFFLVQVCCFKNGSFSQMAPFHRLLEYCGLSETIIVASSYLVSAVLCLVAAYVGLSTA